MENAFHTIVIPYFNFALFLVALYFFARKPLTSLAEGRKAKYLEASIIAKKTQETAQATYDTVAKKMSSIDSELADFLKQSADQSKLEAERIEMEGAKLAAQISNEAQRLSQDEINRAKQTLRSEIVAAAKAAAESKIEQSVSLDEKARILSSKLKDVGSIQIRS